MTGSSLPGRHRHAGGCEALLLGQQPGKEGQGGHGVELVALLLEFFRLFLQILSAVVQPGYTYIYSEQPREAAMSLMGMPSISNMRIHTRCSSDRALIISRTSSWVSFRE